MTARALHWAELVSRGQRWRAIDVLLLAAARYAARKDRGCSELYSRFAGVYATADRLERLKKLH